MNKGYDYARTGNPTRATLESLVAQLEGGSTGVAFASGLAAIDAVLKLLQSGDEIVAVDDIYGGAFRLFEQVYKKFGITVRYVDTSNVETILDALTPKTRLIWIETPTNPTLKISDIRAIAALARAHGCLLCVDNTFASPALQKPLALGADIVVHSGTKYLGGHSDLIAGLVVTADPELGQRVKFLQNACGAMLGPFDSWLLDPRDRDAASAGAAALRKRLGDCCIFVRASGGGPCLLSGSGDPSGPCGGGGAVEGVWRDREFFAERGYGGGGDGFCDQHEAV